MTPQELVRSLVLLVLALPFLAILAHADEPPPELGVSVTSAENCSEGCWRLVALDYEDPDASQGRHHIYGRLIRDGATPGGLPWHVAWPNGNVRLETKPAPDTADFAMYGCYAPFEGERGAYRAYAGTREEQSDVVNGMGLPYCQHVSFYLVWQWQSGPGEPVEPRLWLPLVREP